MKSRRFRSPAKWANTRKGVSATVKPALPVGPINPVTGLPFTAIVKFPSV